MFINAGVSPEIKAANGATCQDMTQNRHTQLILKDIQEAKAKEETKDEL